LKEENQEPLNSQGTGDVAVIGEGTENESRLSIQVLQGIYHELTGKSEDVSKSYEEPFQADLEDFRQLDHRIKQCCEQYNIQASNCSVKVFYVDDTAETFSSFERFNAFNAGSTSPVESVLLTYNFLIVLPKVEKPQSYTLTIRLASKIAAEEQMRERVVFQLPKVLKTMGQRTAIVDVKYVDYSVARSLLNTVDQWFNGLPKETTPKFWKYLLKRTHHIPFLSRYIVGLVVTYLVCQSVDLYIEPSASLRDLAVFLIIAFVGIFAAYRLSGHLGRYAENSLDNWSQLSYLSLTSGDKALLKRAESSNRSSLIRGIASFVSALLVSLAAKIILSFL